MNNKYEVKEKMILIDFLEKVLKKSHKDAKKLLTNKQILVNNKINSKYNTQLNVGDTIIINSFNTNNMDSKVEILYEDKDIIVVNKPAGLLTIATENEKEKTLYHLVSDYTKKSNKNNKVFIIHRLDKETSGIVILAKNEKIKKLYQNNWDDLVLYRGYTAVLEGTLPKYRGKIVQYLKENRDSFKVYVTDKNNGKKAVTLYKVLKENDNYTLVDIEIQTGRKNQIRVAFSSMGYPILGDQKYGSIDKSLKRLALHAYKLTLINPVNKKKMDFEIKVPDEFYRKVK
ncbi:MAG: RluA family pseudouridine synthase [Bacilli bacterium]|nr:RluA family pseudouridine synthase [Bacilli bacterium]